jgi:hypothetical protein
VAKLSLASVRKTVIRSLAGLLKAKGKEHSFHFLRLYLNSLKIKKLTFCSWPGSIRRIVNRYASA